MYGRDRGGKGEKEEVEEKVEEKAELEEEKIEWRRTQKWGSRDIFELTQILRRCKRYIIGIVRGNINLTYRMPP